MAYTNNQYIRLNKPLEEIAKIERKTDKKNRMISDLDIKDYEPNVIIAYGIDNKIDYCNIFSSVRILITDIKTLYGKIEEIPEFIEVIIVDNLIYYDKNDVNSDKDFDLLLFENNEERFEMKVERLIERGKINSYNNVGDTILNYLIINKKEKKAIELIDKMEIETINKVRKNGYPILIWVKIGEPVETYGRSALILACYKKMESVALKLLERGDININQQDTNETTAFIMACENKMECVALKLLERKDLKINQGNRSGFTGCYYADKNNMQSVVNRIIELNKNKRTK